LFSSSPDSASVIPPTALDAIPLLKVEEFGPFRITNKKELRLVSQLVLALLLWQMEGFDASRLVANALGSFDEKDNEDDEDDSMGSDEQHASS
jgi:hypothetical protein